MASPTRAMCRDRPLASLLPLAGVPGGSQRRAAWGAGTDTGRWRSSAPGKLLGAQLGAGAQAQPLPTEVSLLKDPCRLLAGQGPGEPGQLPPGPGASGARCQPSRCLREAPCRQTQDSGLGSPTHLIARARPSAASTGRRSAQAGVAVGVWRRDRSRLPPRPWTHPASSHRPPGLCLPCAPSSAPLVTFSRPAPFAINPPMALPHVILP